MAVRVPPWVRRAARLTDRFDFYHFGRWLVLATAVGVVAGLGAALLTWGVDGVSELLHGHLVGFTAPAHGAGAPDTWSPAERPWVLLLVLPISGLVVGWLVQTFAPEAEGHGTDAVIEAYHRQRATIRHRVVPVKLLASMLTIGSGGSAGREGPVAQVGAGFASYLADLFRLPMHDRRVLVVAGVAAGIGGMFRAPLGGALFAIEVLYSQNEYESEALVPSLIASIVSYVVNASLTGWGVLFRTNPPPFVRPAQLLAYLVLGIGLALIGVVYVKVFYGARDAVFRRLPVPRWVTPAIGTTLLAVMAMFLPQVMGGGYGWIQLTLDDRLSLTLLLLLLPAKLLATTFTISSGGSGGVFAPSLMIGGLAGAIFAKVAERVMPAIAPPPSACVLVGMGAFFAGVAKVPIAALIMVAEMSGSYSLLVPMMLVSSVTFLLTRGANLYEAQVPGRVDSPAHVGEFQVDVLEQLAVRDVLNPATEIVTVRPGMPFEAVLDIVASSAQAAFPVVADDGHMISLFTVDDVRRVVTSPEVWSVLVASDLGMSAESAAWVAPDDDLHSAVRRFSAFGLDVLPVLSGPPPAPLVGLLEQRRVIAAYDGEIRRLQTEAEERSPRASAAAVREAGNGRAENRPGLVRDLE